MMSLLWTPLHNLETSLVQNPAPALIGWNTLLSYSVNMPAWTGLKKTGQVRVNDDIWSPYAIS